MSISINTPLKKYFRLTGKLEFGHFFLPLLNDIPKKMCIVWLSPADDIILYCREISL